MGAKWIIVGIVFIITGSISLVNTIYEDINQSDFSTSFVSEKIHDKIIMFIIEGVIITIGIGLICNVIKSNSSWT